MGAIDGSGCAMSAAAFVVAINLFIAGVFATAFGVVAAYARSSVGARWLALAYGLGMFNPLLELILPLQRDPWLVQFGIFAAYLFATTFIVVGLARHYRLAPPWAALGAIVVISLLVNSQTIAMPRDSILRGFAYQLPYFAIVLMALTVVLRFAHRKALDVGLLILFALSSLQYLLKPFAAVLMGSGDSAQAYIGTTYAALSQSTGAMLLIANGLLMLLIIVRDAMAEITARSETDTLSGLLNRRGFEDRADRLLATALRAGVPGAMVVADLDHFKAINDSHGHEAGDRVIRAFAEMLVDKANEHAVIGRLGGEEFAVFIPGANLPAARHYAEGVRTGFSGLAIADLGSACRVSASFGIARFEAGDSLSDLLRRTDAALYAAKKGGRDRVCVAESDAEMPPMATARSGRRQGSRQAG